MATYNLTGQKIKNTYGQLAQVNDSNKLVDGLGNEKQIVTSSILNFPTEVSRSAAEAGFGAGGGAAWDDITGKPSGLVSSSAQLPQIATNTADISSLTAATSSYLTSLPSGVVSSSAQVDLAQAFGTAANATSALTANLAVTASYALNAGGDTEWVDILNKPSGIVSSSTQTIANVESEAGLDFTLFGLTSIITGAGSNAVRIQGGGGNGTMILGNNGEDLITVEAPITSAFPITASLFKGDLDGTAGSATSANTATSASHALYADSAGSAGSATTSTSASHAIYADTAGTAGSATTATSASHAVQADSALTANSANSATTSTSASHALYADAAGTATSATTATSASYAVTASYALNGGASAGLVAGTGTDSIKNADSLVTTAPIASGDYSIAIGNGANTPGTYSLHISLDDSNSNTTGDQTINIGKDINNQNGYSTAIGHNLTNNGTGGNVLIGRSITTSGDYSIGIGEGAQAGQGGAIAIGQSANSQGNSVAIGAGAVMGNSYGAAIGYNARANNDASIAIGGDVSVSSNQAIAIGTDTGIDASSQGAVSFGQNADIATSTNAVVIGRTAGATGANSGIAIGYGQTVTNANEINIGGKIRYNKNATGSIELSAAVEVPTVTISDSGGTTAVDGAASNYFYLNAAGATTTVANPTKLQNGATYTFLINGGYNVSWDTAYKFPNGSIPTLTSGSDVISFVSIGGSYLYGTAQYNFS